MTNSIYLTEILSRIQFAFTISFHILFPAFSIGLATFLFIMETAWIKTKNPKYLQICKYWLKVFALTFGMGVVSGVVMEFQFGTNWSVFTRDVGPILGSLFTWEVLTAFFIEAGFLGVMIFGWDKVGNKLHYTATTLVFLGVTLSAFWIMSANSWMQTPAGFDLKNGVFAPKNWLHIIFSPSFIVRYVHMMIATYLSTLFAIIAVSSYYLYKNIHISFATICIKFSAYCAFILMLMQLVMGDMVGTKVHEYQPIKTAAIEGVWDTQKGAPLLLFAIPDSKTETNKYTVSIPHIASLINTHKWDGELLGLKSVPKADRPNVPFVFWSFRIMVGLGLLMLFLSALISLLTLREKIQNYKRLLKIMVYMFPIGFISLETGWITAEVGRQPWVVYNLFKTSDAVSKVSLSHVVISFGLIIVVYLIIFGIFYSKYLRKSIIAGPIKIDDKTQPFNYLQASLQTQERKLKGKEE